MTDDGIVILVNEIQLKNVQSPIEVTDDGIVILVNESQLLNT